MEESSILSFKILFLDTTENGPLMLQEIFFILSRLNFFSPPFHKKKKRSGRGRESKTRQAKHLLFFGEPRSPLTISGQPQEKYIPGWEYFAGGVIIN